MKFRIFLRNLLPVCVLAIASCTNEEIILDASQTQRGRDFASAFEARFGSVDPNHTWVDGSVGKVTVTTDQAENIVIYGLGRTDGTLLRLKRCVVNGTQEVKYDIPAGCQKVVLRAYNNNNFNEYKTLDPSNENDVADMTAAGTRASNATTMEEYMAQNNPRARQLIPDVWNAYGNVAPWQTPIPNVTGIAPHYVSGNGWNFFFESGGTEYNVLGSTYNLATGILRNFVPQSLFADDAAFMAASNFASSDQDVNWQKLKVETITETSTDQWGNVINTITYKLTITDKNGVETVQTVDISNNSYGKIYTTDLSGNGVMLPDGEYYNFKSFGKRGSWWWHHGAEYGQFYVTSMDITNATTGSLSAAPDYFSKTLNDDVISEILDIVTPDNQYNTLKPFVTDAGFTTLAPGPVTVTWFTGVTSTRDYVGYYYTTGEDTEAKEDAADKYLLLDAYSGARQRGDTYPLTYYDPDGTSAPSYTFPAGVNIHFFVVHGRGSTINGVEHPQSPSTWTTSNSQADWLFYDTNTGKWTLNAWYAAYSQGGDINEASLMRLYEEFSNGPDSRIQSDFGGNYIPSMSFNYAGYNVIGFEDTPSGTDLDWNDCTFIVNGNFEVKKWHQQDLAFSMCMEDLGGTDDLDYNDLFMVVTQGYEEITTNASPAPQTYYSAPKVIIPMVGGTLPLKITFEPENEEPQVLFEDVHAAFGQGLTDVAINTCEPGTYSDNIRNISGEPDYKGTVFTVDFADGSVVKCANFKARNDAEAEDVSTVFDASRWDADHIASFSILDHIPDFKIWVTYDNGQELCISGPKNLQVGEDVSDAQKIPFAFWFPSTAGSEQESEDNPETRVLPGYERQFINNALPGFAEWVANQDAYSADGRNNWYNWAWGTNGPVTPGSGNSGGGDNPGGDDTPTTMTYTVPAQFIQSMGIEWTVGNQSNLIPASNFLNEATTIQIDITFLEAVVDDNTDGNSTNANIAFYTNYNYNNNMVSQTNVVGKTSLSVTIDDATAVAGILSSGLSIQLWNGVLPTQISSIVITSSK